MPKKPNAYGMQEYIPAGNGDASGEYADGEGSNRHFTAFKKPDGEGEQDKAAPRLQISKRSFFNKGEGIGDISAVDKSLQKADKIAAGVQDEYHNRQFKSIEEAIDYGRKNGIQIDDKVEKMDTIQTINSLSQIIALKKHFNVNEIKVSAGRYGRAIAFVSLEGDHSIKMSFNPLYYGGSEQTLTETKLKGRSTHFYADFSDEFANVSTATHEFGHVVIHSLILRSNYEQKRRDAIEDIVKAKGGKASMSYLSKLTSEKAKQIRNEVFYYPFLNEVMNLAGEYDPHIKEVTENYYAKYPRMKGKPVLTFISNYGKTDYDEYIAEAFMNGLCGKPTAVGKAMVETAKRWLEEDYKK